MNLHNLPETESREIQQLLQNWARKHPAPADGRDALLRTVVRSGFKRRPNRVVVFIQGLARPYWAGRPQMSYSELSKWLFNRAMIDSLGASRPELRLVT